MATERDSILEQVLTSRHNIPQMGHRGYRVGLRYYRPSAGGSDLSSALAMGFCP